MTPTIAYQQASHLRRAHTYTKEAHQLFMDYLETLKQLHALGESCPAEEKSARSLTMRASDLALHIADAMKQTST